MAKGEVANHLEEEAQGHRRNTESVVTDGAHRDEPGNDYWDKGRIGQIGVYPLHRTEPEEADKEE